MVCLSWSSMAYSEDGSVGGFSVDCSRVILILILSLGGGFTIFEGHGHILRIILSLGGVHYIRGSSQTGFNSLPAHH